MPRTRRQLTNSQEEEHRARVRRLHALGIATGTAEDLPSKSKTLSLRQVDPELATAYDLPNGGIAVVAACELKGLKSGVTICDCMMRTSWDGPDLDVLRNPQASVGCDLPQYEYPSSRILNRWLNEKVALERGRIVEGVVIATGRTSIPEQYKSGMPVMVELWIRDQFDNLCREPIWVTVDRSLKQKQKYLREKLQYIPAPPRNANRGLFEPEDQNEIVPNERPRFGDRKESGVHGDFISDSRSAKEWKRRLV